MQADKIICPHCKGTFGMDIKTFIPEKQIVSIKITTETELMSAQTIGKAILNMEGALLETAKQLKVKVAVFIKEIKYNGEKEINIDFCVLEIKKSDTPLFKDLQT